MSAEQDVYTFKKVVRGDEFREGLGNICNSCQNLNPILQYLKLPGACTVIQHSLIDGPRNTYLETDLYVCPGKPDKYINSREHCYRYVQKIFFPNSKIK